MDLTRMITSIGAWQNVARQLTEKRRHEIEDSLQLLGERPLVIVPDAVVQGRVDDDAQFADQLKEQGNNDYLNGFYRTQNLNNWT